jgi:hypothetical protein
MLVALMYMDLEWFKPWFDSQPVTTSGRLADWKLFGMVPPNRESKISQTKMEPIS